MLLILTCFICLFSVCKRWHHWCLVEWPYTVLLFFIPCNCFLFYMSSNSASSSSSSSVDPQKLQHANNIRRTRRERGNLSFRSFYTSVALTSINSRAIILLGGFAGSGRTRLVETFRQQLCGGGDQQYHHLNHVSYTKQERDGERLYVGVSVLLAQPKAHYRYIRCTSYSTKKSRITFFNHALNLLNPKIHLKSVAIFSLVSCSWTQPSCGGFPLKAWRKTLSSP